MDNMTIQLKSRTQGASRFATPTRGCAFGIEQTLVVTDFPATTASSDRKAVAVKGHMALVAYVPGIHAWSPPLC